MERKARTLLGGFGSVALIRYSNDALGFATSLILAKLLVPEDFGVVAAAAMIIEMLQIFKDLGLSQALIYRQEDVHRATDTAFLMVVVLNVVIFLCATLVSPLAGKFFDNSQVALVIVVIASNLIWTSIRSIPDALITKELAFHKLLVPEILPAMTGSIVGISMAYKGFGAWSLVVRSVIVSAGGMMLIWAYTSYRPKWNFDWKIAKELLSYGKYIIGSSIVLVAAYNVDKLMVSKFGGVAALGIYVMATKIANLPISEFSHIICRLMFPVFTKMRQDLYLLRQSFLKTMRYNCFITFPMAIGIALYGPDLIHAIYGDKWSGMAVPLQLLSVAALFRSLSVIIHETFKATGSPRFMQRFVTLRFVIIAGIGIPVIMWYGLIGMCGVVVAAYGVVLVCESIKVSEQLNLARIDILTALRLPFALSVSIIPSIHWLVQASFSGSHLIQSVGGILLTTLCYGVTVFISDKVLVAELREAFSPVPSSV